VALRSGPSPRLPPPQPKKESPVYDALQAAFRSAFIDLCRHGLCHYDEEELDRLWLQFKTEMEGFPSLFDVGHEGQWGRE